MVYYMEIAFIGLGKLGMPCAEAIAKKGHDVYGFDIKEKKSHFIKIANTLQECVDKKSIIFIAVPTPHEKEYDGSSILDFENPKNFNYDILKNVISEIVALNLDKSVTVVIISTVLPGTIRNEIQFLFSNIIYNPYLIAMSQVEEDFYNPELVILGASNKDSNTHIDKLIDFYQTIVDNNPYYVKGTWEECESVKIFYNTFISFKITFANMIQDFSQKIQNIDVDIVTDALKHSNDRLISPKYLTAGMGDGGACHPRDNIALSWLAKNYNLNYDIFGLLMHARQEQAKTLANFCIKKAGQYPLPFVIVGRYYKETTTIDDGSYSLLVAEFAKIKYLAVKIIEPDEEINYPALFLLSYGKLNFEPVEGSIVVDLWRTYFNDNIEVIHYGNTYKG